MTTWSPTFFARGLASLRAFAESEPELSALARADFPPSWDSEAFPELGVAVEAWRLHGREDAEGRTAADRRLSKEGSRLSRAERALLAALGASWCSVFEVEEVRLGEGLRLRDLLLDEVLEVRERSLTVQVEEEDVVVLWVMPVKDHLELVASAVLVPPARRGELVAAARQQLTRLPPGADGHRRVRRLAPLLFRRVMEWQQEQRSAEPPLTDLSELLTPPRRRAFLDAARRRPRRSAAKEAPLEPGSAYVFKLGPIETRMDGYASLYVAATSEGEVLPPVLGRKDVEGLTELSRQLGGRKRYCERRLVRVGAALGFTARPMPAALARLRAGLALQAYWGPEKPEALHLDLMDLLLESAVALIRAGPWDLWTDEEIFPVHLEGSAPGTRELSVLGAGENEYGFVLFDRPGSMERLALTGPFGKKVDLLVPDSLGLTLEDEPPWAVKAVQEVTALPFLPEVIRFQRNMPRPATAEEVLVAAVVARALASARPEAREAQAELRAGDLRVRARLEVPLPLLSGRYVGPPLPPRDSGWRPTPSRPPRREVPTRKVSETLLAFAEPLLEDARGEEDPQEALFLILALAMSAWNAVVQDTWEAEKGQVERARATLRRMPKGDREQMTRAFEQLVQRKRRHFADDPRVFDALDVVVHHKGDLTVRLVGVVTPGAWEEFLGV
jgi:hypothetical protein